MLSSLLPVSSLFLGQIPINIKVAILLHELRYFVPFCVDRSSSFPLKAGSTPLIYRISLDHIGMVVSVHDLFDVGKESL